jgi:hypothetical protein
VRVAGAAYGVRVVSSPSIGLPADALRIDGADSWPCLRLFVAGDVEASLTSSAICHERPEGKVWVDPERGLVELPPLARLRADFIVHPLLSTAAWLWARALSEIALHAGAFAGAGGAWVVLGDRGAGKSTLLASLARRGVTVLSDDLVVFRGTRVCAGPRCVDLRPDAADLLGVRSPVRGGERYRTPLEPCDAEQELAGFIHLRWGSRVQLERQAPEQRLRWLLARLPSASPSALLELASKPSFEFGRPRDLRRCQVGADELAALLIAQRLDSATAAPLPPRSRQANDAGSDPRDSRHDQMHPAAAR